MSSCPERAAGLVGAVMLALASGGAQAQSAMFAGIGRAATAQEIAVWDIDVRPDFKGLPRGAGTVAQGMAVWESRCASCHGVFGESNEFFSPIVGGTTAADMNSGTVASLRDGSFPGRTTLMKLSSLSTLWDYIRRAMPWTEPKSLSVDEVYAVTAYILNLGGIVPDSFTLSERNVADVQQRLPNRNGTTSDHALWPGVKAGQRAPDVAAVACMKDCAAGTKVSSLVPDFARNAHGNLAQQNRLVGAQRGADTSSQVSGQASGQASGHASGLQSGAATAALNQPGGGGAAAAAAVAVALMQKHGCMACHGMESKVVGPAFRDIAQKYSSTADAAGYLAAKTQAGGAGVWGAVAMPAQALPAADAAAIAAWLASGAKR